jgi:hypothetical protein
MGGPWRSGLRAWQLSSSRALCHHSSMTASLTNYIVFYEDTPNASRHLAATSPLNAVKDFVLQNKAGVSDAVIVVRTEANLNEATRFQNTGGIWSQLPASDMKTGTNASSHLPATSPAGGRRMVCIKSVSILYAALYGGAGYGLAAIIAAIIAAIVAASAMGAGMPPAMANYMFGGIVTAILIGAVGGALGALFYNVISAVTGGLRVELADDDNPL